MMLTRKEKRTHMFLHIFTLVSITLWLICNVVYVNASTLDDVLDKKEITSEKVEYDSETKEYVSSDVVLSGYGDITDFTETSPIAEKVNGMISQVVRFAIQILSYGIVSLLVLRIMLDLLYIAVPFSRVFLSKGAVRQTDTMPTNNMSAMGFGGVYGQSGMDSMNQPTMSVEPNIPGKIKWVSEAAELAVGASYNGENPYKIYVKDMTIFLVLTPILLVLAITGALTDIGFWLAEVIINGIVSIKDMI